MAASTLTVTRLGHVNLFAESLAPALRLQRTLFGAHIFSEWSDGESHNALALAGRTCLETFAPTTPAGPVGRWVARFGGGWHSLEWTVPSLPEALRVVTAHGMRITEQHERYLFVHPADLHGMALELSDAHFDGDPRDELGHDPGVAGPLGIIGVPTVRVAAASPKAARRAAERVGALVGRPMAANPDPGLAAVGYAVAFGDHVVEFVAPAGVSSAVPGRFAADPLSAFVAARGSRIFALALEVADLGVARDHAARLGLVCTESEGGGVLADGPVAGGLRIQLTAAPRALPAAGS